MGGTPNLRASAHGVLRLTGERRGFGDGRGPVAAAQAHAGPTGSGEQLRSPRARGASQARPRAALLVARVQWTESRSRKQL